MYSKYKIPLPKQPTKEVVKYQREEKFSPIKTIKTQRSNLYWLNYHFLAEFWMILTDFTLSSSTTSSLLNIGSINGFLSSGTTAFYLHLICDSVLKFYNSQLLIDVEGT